MKIGELLNRLLCRRHHATVESIVAPLTTIHQQLSQLHDDAFFAAVVKHEEAFRLKAEGGELAAKADAALAARAKLAALLPS